MLEIYEEIISDAERDGQGAQGGRAEGGRLEGGSQKVMKKAMIVKMERCRK